MLRSIARQPLGAFALVVLVVVALAAVISPFWTPWPPLAADPSRSWLPASAQHWFGTDASGRDIASYLLSGATASLGIALASAAIAAMIGLALGALGALTRTLAREVVAIAIDVLVAFPTLLIAMMLAAVFGGSLGVVIVAVGVGAGVNIARVMRAEIHRIGASDYVLAAFSFGQNRRSVLRWHILPNVAPVFIVQLSLTMGVAVLAEAGLSYLGFGAPANVPSWGRMLAEIQPYMSVHPLSVIWPGLLITLTVLAFNLLGDALRNALDAPVGNMTNGAIS